MPNRMIKDTIRTSKHVNELSDFHFRVWLYLITYVDDYGRGSADPELLKGLVFPRRRGVTEEQIEGALTLLANKGMITLYEVDGESYFYFPSWGEHQRIQTKKSKFPDPQKSTVIHREPPPKPNQTKRETKTETEEETETKNQNTNILSEKENGQKKEPLPAGVPAQREFFREGADTAGGKAGGPIPQPPAGGSSLSQREPGICPITKAEAEEILNLPTKEYVARVMDLPVELQMQLAGARSEMICGSRRTPRPWDSR